MKLDVPDISQYFTRDSHPDRTKIPLAVTIVLDTESLECSGIVLAHHSPTLRDMITVSSEIFLDMFAGQKGVLEDCLDMLHGADVRVGMDNIQGLLKFSKFYKVDKMFRKCLKWVCSNINTDNLLALLKVGRFLAGLDENEESVIDACLCFLMKGLGEHQLSPVQITKALNLTKNIKEAETINFLLNENLISTSFSILPVITEWMECGEAVTLVLERIEKDDLFEKVYEIGSDECTIDFVEKLHDHAQEAVNPLKILNKLQNGLLKYQKVKRVKTAHSNDAGTTIGPANTTLPIMLEVINGSNIGILWWSERCQPFVYAEIVLAWLRRPRTRNGVAKNVVKEFWGLIKQDKLCYEYLVLLRDSLMAVSNQYELPLIQNLGRANYKLNQLISITSNEEFVEESRQSLLGPRHHYSMHGDCTVRGCNLPARTRGFVLQDSVPCYDFIGTDGAQGNFHYHPGLVKHWYLSTVQNGQRVLLSLVTNSYKEVLEVLVEVEKKSLAIHCLETDFITKQQKGARSGIIVFR